jgi:hypothetical protein
VGIPGYRQFHRGEVLERTLAEMRSFADVMARLEVGQRWVFSHDRSSTVADEPASQSDNRDERPSQIDADQRWQFEGLPPPSEVIATRDFNAEIKHDDIEHEITFER